MLAKLRVAMMAVDLNMPAGILLRVRGPGQNWTCAALIYPPWAPQIGPRNGQGPRKTRCQVLPRLLEED